MHRGKLVFSPLTVTGFVLLFFGLGVVLFASQQQQNTRSSAYGGTTPAKSCTARGGSCYYSPQVYGINCPGGQINLSLRNADCQQQSSTQTLIGFCCITQDKLKLVAPTLNASASTTQITLSWKAVGDTYNWLHPEPGTVTGYYIFRNGTPITAVTGTTYVDTKVTQNTTYTYQVQAIASPPNYSSGLSKSVSVKASATSTNPLPSGGTTDGSGTTGSSGDAKYIGKNCTTPQGSGTCQYRNSYPCSGQWVTSYCPGSNNVVCCVPSIPVPVADTTAPSAPANLTTTAVSPTQITLSWTAATDNVGVIDYKIFRNSTPITAVTGTTYEDMDLTPDTTYVYYVIASDAAGNNSQRSNEATEKTASLHTTLRLNLTIHGIGLGEFDVPNSGWRGDDPIRSLQVRDVKVQVYEITDQGSGQKIAEGTGQVGYADGKYTSIMPIEMGTNLPLGNHNYNIRIDSGSAFITAPRTITGGKENTIMMTLANGDADQNGLLNIFDYSLIYSCVEDKSVGKIPTELECSNENKLNADIDSDGKVYYYDLLLVSKEFVNSFQ